MSAQTISPVMRDRDYGVKEWGELWVTSFDHWRHGTPWESGMLHFGIDRVFVLDIWCLEASG